MRLFQIVKYTDNSKEDEEEEDWVGLDTTFFIAKIQSNYSNDGRIFFSFLLLVVH